MMQEAKKLKYLAQKSKKKAPPPPTFAQKAEKFTYLPQIPLIIN